MIANLLTQWSRLLVESLADAGIEHAVISPGSRSTAFVAAALGCARLHCESVIDERSAAFVAVGRAKLTGRPSLLVCTSGSAAANYFPAIVEARQSRTPLVVLTADRPLELSDCRAPQTIDQVKLYGDQALYFFDIGAPVETTSALVALRRVAAQAVARSRAGPAGPVHLNARAHKPLEPRGADGENERDLVRRVDALLAEPIVHAPAPERRPPAQALESVAESCRQAKTGLIVAGPADPWNALEPGLARSLADATGFSLFAEATSQLRFGETASAEGTVDALDLVLRDPAISRHASFDVVLQIGSPPTSAALDIFLRRNGSHAARHVLAEHDWPDPIGTADTLLVGDLGPTVRALCTLLRPGAPSRRLAWLAPANRAARCAADRLVGDASALTEAVAVRATIDSLPAGALLAVSNSLPVREVDLFCPAVDRRIAVWSQRGASGIDGVLSGAVGAAAGWSGAGPAALLIGDVALLHDIGGLLVASTLKRPLAIVVLNNDGGRIFDQLPVARSNAIPEANLRYWTTPHGLGFEHAAALYGLAFARPANRGELEAALAAAYETPAATVIEVPVGPSAPRRDVDDLLRLFAEELARVDLPKGPAA